MENKRYKPLIDFSYFLIWIPISIFLILMSINSFESKFGWIIMLFIDLFTFYFLITSLFGYVQLKENSLFIKFGLILNKEIPYDKIKEIKKERSFITYSPLSLKNALEHVNIKYNKYDLVTVSVKNNDVFIKELTKKIY